MAQQSSASYRTGSLSSFFKLNSKSFSRDNYNRATDLTAHTSHKTRSQSSSSIRPSSPLMHRANEAHIHRIRSAISREDSKHNFHLITPSIQSTKPPLEMSKSSESENDDVESLDWTAPLDITTYLYKPEYVIRPSSKASTKDRDLIYDNSSFPTVETNASSSTSLLKLPNVGESNSTPQQSIKDEFVKNYVRKSIQRDRRRQLFNRDMSDYANFIGSIKNELREMSEETKRLETQSPRTTRKQEARDEIIQRGYETLKRMYELNPDLTESAAKKNICGPPGNHWMGLSRVEVLRILQQIRKELGVPPNKYSCDDPKMNFFLDKDKKSQKKGKRKIKKPTKKPSAGKDKTKRLPRVKTPLVPLQHVPGPKYLHTNVCIRPWEATLDGWNLATELNVDDRQPRLCQSTGSQADIENPQNSPQHSPETSSQSSLPEEYSNASLKAKSEEDYITLEIFNPVFKVHR